MSYKLLDNEAADKLAALDRSQATIEFDLDGAILTANENFLAVLGFRQEIKGQRHANFLNGIASSTTKIDAATQKVRESSRAVA